MSISRGSDRLLLEKRYHQLNLECNSPSARGYHDARLATGQAIATTATKLRLQHNHILIKAAFLMAYIQV